MDEFMALGVRSLSEGRQGLSRMWYVSRGCRPTWTEKPDIGGTGRPQPLASPGQFRPLFSLYRESTSSLMQHLLLQSRRLSQSRCRWELFQEQGGWLRG